MMLTRLPRPSLRPLVRLLWASDAAATSTTTHRERVLPTGDMHLAFRLNHPLRLFRDINDLSGETVGHAVIGGACVIFSLKEISQPMEGVGAQLRPGASQILFRMPAEELAGHHTPLVDVWGSSANRIREQLLETCNLAKR